MFETNLFLTRLTLEDKSSKRRHVKLYWLKHIFSNMSLLLDLSSEVRQVGEQLVAKDVS
jgi:hypothetical protein